MSKRPLDLEPVINSKKTNYANGDHSQKVIIGTLSEVSIFGSIIDTSLSELPRRLLHFVNTLRHFKEYLSASNRNPDHIYVWSWTDTIDGSIVKFILNTVGPLFIKECINLGIQFHLTYRGVRKMLVEDQITFESSMNLINKIDPDLKWMDHYYCDYVAYLHNIVYKNKNMCLSGAWINTQDENNSFSTTSIDSINYIANQKLHLRCNLSLLGRVIQVTFNLREHVFSANELKEKNKKMMMSVGRLDAINITCYTYNNFNTRTIIVDF
jgi:hypothetical protein